MVTDLGSSLESWHRRLAAVVGAMALTLVRRGLTRGMLTEWATELERVAREVRGTEGEMDEHARVK